MKMWNIWLLSAASLVAMTGCGSSTTGNTPPIIQTDNALNIEVDVPVTLTGNGSDPDGTIVAYEWKEGDTVLSDQATFEYVPTTVGTHTLTLTVTDDDGASTTDTVTVTVLETPNQPPVADAGADRTVTVDDAVALNGSGSDPDGSIAAYEWKEGGTLLSNTASFTYVPATAGTHTLTLTVTDDDGATATDTMTVTATEIPNQTPTADAGADMTMMLNTPATITGTATDPDGTIVDVNWSENGNTIATTLSFDYTPTVAGDHTLTLTVTDDDGATASDTMTVTANANQIPTVNAGPNRSVRVNYVVGITGTASDPDGTIVDVEWSENGSVIATTLSFNYRPTTTGAHTLTLTVTDDDGATVSDTMVVNATSAPAANQAPTANAGGDKSVTVNTAVTITGSGSDSDGTIVGYEWKEGSTVLSTSSSFSYTPTATGTHTLTLTVTDDDGATGSDSMTVTATQANNPPTGEDFTVNANGAATYSVDLSSHINDADGDSLTVNYIGSGVSFGDIDIDSANTGISGTTATIKVLSGTGEGYIDYTVSDGTDTSATYRITINDLDGN